MTTPTPSPSTPAKPKKTLWRRLLKWTIRTFIVLFVLALTAYALTYYWAAKTLNAEVARIRAAGEPLTFADLDAMSPKVDRAQDAGPYYTAAAELAIPDFEAVDANHEALFGHNAPALTPEILTLARRSLDQNHFALDLLDRGSALPGCNSDIQFQLGFDAAFPHMGKARGLINVSSLRSRVLALDGQGDRAIESLISSLGLLRTMDRQPVMLDALVQTAMLGRACDDTRFVLEQGHLTDAAIQKLSAAMVRLHLIQPRQMFIAERVFFLEIVRDGISMGPGDNQPGGATFPNKMWSSLGVTGRVMAARSLPSYGRYIDAASGDWPGVFTAIQHEADKPAYLWDQITSGSFVRSMVLSARQLSAYRSTLIALQIERYRLTHAGTLPASLADLPNPKDLPLDPFTGNPLLYIKTPNGYCIMSAGRNHPEDDSRHIDRDQDPIAWSQRWGIHIRTSLP